MATDEEKHKRIVKKMDAFMADVAIDIMDDGAFEDLTKKVKKELSDLGVPFTTANLKTFVQGVTFGVGAIVALGQGGLAPVLAGLKKLVADMDTPKNAAVDAAMTEPKVAPKTD